MTKWRTQVRRQMNDRDVVTRGIHTDCLLNYETVKYFGGEEHEGQRYRAAIRDYQVMEYKVMSTCHLPLFIVHNINYIDVVSLNMLNLVQNFIIVSELAVWQSARY